MVQYDHLANLLNHLVNSRKVRKSKCEFRPFNKLMLAVLKVMEKNGYIKKFEGVKDSRGGVIKIELGNLNFCKAIKPRFNVKKGGFNKYTRRFLPARNFGIIIVSTNKGILTHKEAVEKDLGGRLLAYCY